MVAGGGTAGGPPVVGGTAASGETAAPDAYRVAAATPDPELPMVTIEDLGILRSVGRSPDGGVTVTITPTYSGCPATHQIGADVAARLRRAGFGAVTVAVRLAPPWSSDWITGDGRRKLAEAGIAPPPEPGSRAGGRRAGPVPLTLTAPPPPDCPRCGAAGTVRTAEFGATACLALYRCTACGEPFEAVKPL